MRYAWTSIQPLHHTLRERLTMRLEPEALHVDSFVVDGTATPSAGDLDDLLSPAITVPVLITVTILATRP